MNVVEGEDPLTVVQDRRAHIDQTGEPIGIRAREVVSRLDEIDCVRGNVFQGPVTNRRMIYHKPKYAIVYVEPRKPAGRGPNASITARKTCLLVMQPTTLASGTPTAFALVRTMGLRPDVEQIVDPCVGTIRRHGSDADRQP